MAFNPGAVDYRSQIMAEERGLSRLNEAKDRQRQRQAEIDRKKAAKRSTLSKLASAGLRGAAAYYTGGLSETMGGGQMIDRLALGEGAERNEYGDLVGAASQIGGAMTAKKAQGVASKLAQGSSADQRMQARLDALAEGTGAKEDFQRAFDFEKERRIRDRKNKEMLDKYSGLGFLGAFSKPEGIDYGEIDYTRNPIQDEYSAPQMKQDIIT